MANVVEANMLEKTGHYANTTGPEKKRIDLQELTI